MNFIMNLTTKAEMSEQEARDMCAMAMPFFSSCFKIADPTITKISKLSGKETTVSISGMAESMDDIHEFAQRCVLWNSPENLLQNDTQTWVDVWDNGHPAAGLRLRGGIWEEFCADLLQALCLPAEALAGALSAKGFDVSGVFAQIRAK